MEELKDNDMIQALKEKLQWSKRETKRHLQKLIAAEDELERLKVERVERVEYEAPVRSPTHTSGAVWDSETVFCSQISVWFFFFISSLFGIWC